MMAPHQQRVVEEKEALDTKLAALRMFIASAATFGPLATDEKERLWRQVLAMEEYSKVLAERISCFPKDTDGPATIQPSQRPATGTKSPPDGGRRDGKDV